MGMTDKQFNGFLRLILSRLNEVANEQDEEKKSKKLADVIDNLQATLED